MYVGVILNTVIVTLVSIRIPHVCGGDPSTVWLFRLLYTCVFPMYVGVIPAACLSVRSTSGIPHVCGGDPTA